MGRLTYSDEVDAVRRVAANVQRIGATGWARSTCPLCVSRIGTPDRGSALGINFATGGYHCFRCHAKGHVDGVGEHEREGPPLPRRTAVESVSGLGPPDDFCPLWREPGATALSLAPAREYLARRGVPSQTVEEVGIGACTKGEAAGRVVVPIVDTGGSWVGWQARLWSSRPTRSPKYLTATGMDRERELFNAPALDVETDAPCLLVEGTFDALPYWPDVVAFLGKPSEGQVGRLYSAKRPLVVALDGDSWLEAEMLALRLRFDRRRAGWVRLPPTRDPNTVDPAWLWGEARRSLEE